MSKGKHIDLSGQKFNYWTVLNYAGHGNWLCQCDCGNIKEVRGDGLKNGHSKSCGCKLRDVQDLTGQKFGRLTVLKLHHIRTVKSINNKTRNIRYYLCKCDCGNKHIVSQVNLKNGNTKSCGCLNLDNLHSGKNRQTHNLSKNRIYKIYMGMKKRCCNSKSKNYISYGGRGIIICDEWLNDFMSFYNWAMTNGYQDNLTIDRINVNGNYSPENCRWATMQEQANNKRTNHKITYNNETHNISEWSSILGIKRQTLDNRINKLKYTIDKAFK